MIEMTDHYEIIGLMSGTSLDGLDVAFCAFDYSNNKWSFQILKAVTFSYTPQWQHKLSEAMNLSADQLASLHMEYGEFIGKQVNQFINDIKLKPDFIASHGHTVFHRPDLGYTFQLGSGAAIAAITGIETICDFRSQDVAFKGQGAPLVPVGDKLLFSEYDICLNLGGFANVSHEINGRRIAYDICPTNLALNFLAGKTGLDYDNNGQLASSGNIIPGLLNNLNSIGYYQLKPPKSLGKEWFDAKFIPVLNDYSSCSVNDLLCTVSEHIADRIAIAVKGIPQEKMLVTGGGAYNRFLIDRIKSHPSINLVIPDDTTLQFKEAMIFAFLGVLRLKGETNCLSSVTGASRDHCSGSIYKPN
jgi:anhydro-N-acetylmuramic acid kinase